MRSNARAAAFRDPRFEPLTADALDDGRVIERVQPRTVRRSAASRPGERVLVWYDPADPADILVYGRDGRWSDRAFLTVGAALGIDCEPFERGARARHAAQA